MSPAPRSFAASLLVITLAMTTLVACPEDKVVVTNLFLEVSSEAPAAGTLDRLRVLFQRGDAHYPVSINEAAFNPSLDGRDIVTASLLLSIPYDGATFGDGRDVVVNITGWANGEAATRFEGQIDLTTSEIVKVRLLALPSGCDGDGDGFLDCGVAGCCAANTVFGDCEGADATANPWAVEAECEPCSDTVDQDCRGGDSPCVDADRDGIADCQEEATCGLGDPRSGPGMPEICDGKDNDCDGAIDEGLFLAVGGRLLVKGDACGLGACAGGVVACAASGAIACSSDGQRAAKEDCATPEDDNCNGQTNEGCVLGDFDGDGALAPADCNDFDAGVFPGRVDEPCCAPAARGNASAEAACDLNCDGAVAFCAAGDVDGDGFTTAQGDCNDNDPSVAPGKPENCKDDIDQDCVDGPLACDGLVDVDGDGWAAGADCNDGDSAIGPGQPEVCNGKDDDCDGLVDEGDPGGGGQCGDTDVGECAFGIQRCQGAVGAAGQVACVGAVGAAESESCDGLDNDCDGVIDNGFAYEGLAIGAACDGVGACGAGVVECASNRTDLATCSTNPNGSRSGATIEKCDALDNDCDGELNEGLTDVAESDCLKLGVCLTNIASIVARCGDDGVWLCDYSNVAGYEAGVETQCDELDNDCDGSVNEDLTFTDLLGVHAFGTACDGDDADQCANGVVACAAGSTTRTTCVETGAPLAEVCDGLDNDCDGLVDEDFKVGGNVGLVGALFAGDDGKHLAEVCGAGECGAGVVECAGPTTLRCSSDPRTVANPSAPADVCDGLDNDCDGATDEGFLAGGNVKLSGALRASDNGKVKGDACGAGECAGGTVVCGSETTLVCSTDANGQVTTGGQVVSKTDICNGKDDNCNGTTDDDFVATTGANRKPLAGALFAGDNGKVKGAACGVGQCAKDPTSGAASPGIVQCNAAGTALVCSSDGRASTDVCDNLDNDCDGTDDQQYRSPTGTTLQGAKLATDNGKVKGAACGAGACANGKVACAANKTALVCDSDGKATAESCDTVDNDCDGTKDDGFTLGGLPMGAACDGVGACGPGVVVCATGSTTTAACSTDVNGTTPQASPEVCDGVDNDCDNETDEGFSYNFVSIGGGCTGVGACGTGTVVCTTSGNEATCSTMPGAPGVSVGAEICDGIDNNCDGVTDEGFSYLGVAVGGACTGTGRCAGLPNGKVECTGGAAICSTNPGGSNHGADVAETCDGTDQDCDGVADAAEATLVGAPPCAKTSGVCAGATTPARLCLGAGGYAACDDAAYAAHDAAYDPDNDICDNKDNDCDTFTDKLDVADFVRQDCEKQSGVCAGAKKNPDKCVAGVWTGTCQDNDEYIANNAAYGAEICDGLDNNCDAELDRADADLVIPACELTVGECLNAKKPVTLCTETLAGWQPCGATEYNAVSAALHNGVSHYSVVETCDTFDNDCKGGTDAADAGLDRILCNDQDGVCKNVKRLADKCQNGAWLDCVTGVGGDYDVQLPANDYPNEICDNKDNDCDNDTDANDLSLQNDVPCELQEGVCEGTVKPRGLCVSGVWGACTTTAGGTYATQRPAGDVVHGRYGAETCDNRDNNCDTFVDEGDAFHALDVAYNTADVGLAKSEPCGTGVCDPGNEGVVQCNAGETALECSTDRTPPRADETCNELDDDCDGATDEELDADEDDTCDGLDDCVDADEDGWGTLGPNSQNPYDLSGCANSQTAEDCNDAPLNTQDTDADNVCDTGSGRPCTGLNTPTGCDDNCPAVANATQADTDTNGKGDACQDTDSDGILDHLGSVFCDNPVVLPCKDNCRVVANPTQVDTDNNGEGDACDECTAAYDLDNDTVCDLGTRTTCVGDVRVDCDDNCPVDSNLSQADGNDNGVGDACDPCSAGLTEPYEVCADCLDNDCDGDADDSTCVYRRIIGIETDASGVVAGHSISLTFDHAFLIASGASLNATGDDIRVYYRNPSNVWVEIDRVLDPESAWGAATTKIWFKAQAGIIADVSDGDEVNTDYYFYAGVAGRAKHDEQGVFHFADLFDRVMVDPTKVGPDDTIDTPPIDAWRETETTEGLLSVSGDSLAFDTEDNTDELMRPVGYRQFTAITEGRWRWRTKWNWTRSGDNTFALLAQLGDSTTKFADPPTVAATYPNLGVGPMALWARNVFGADSGTQNFGATDGTTMRKVVTTYSGSSLVDIDLDFAHGTFTLDPDGALGSLSPSAAIDFNNKTLTRLDAIRFVSHDQDKDDFNPRKFDYVWIQRLTPWRDPNNTARGAEDEPVAYLGVKEPLGAACVVTNPNTALGRWYLDDARDDVLGAAATTLSDEATSLDLTRAPSSGPPNLVEHGNQRGLQWTVAGGGGTAAALYAATKMAVELHNSKTATIEVVAELKGASSESFIVDFQRATGEHQLALSVTPAGELYTLKLYLNNTVAGSWVAALPKDERGVFTLVIDTAQADASARLRLFRDGSPLTTISGAKPELNLMIDLDDPGTLRLGNNLAGTSSPAGYIYFVAVYQTAMTDDTVQLNALALRADDDRR